MGCSFHPTIDSLWIYLYRPRHVMATVEAIVQEASHVPVFLPNVSALNESLRKATEWSDKVDKVQVCNI